MSEPEVSDHVALFPKLGVAIDTALAIWQSYLVIIAEQPSYATILSSGEIDAVAKMQALKHVLETLPARHNALIRSFNDPDMDYFELSELCSNLLEELYTPDSDLDLGEWFNKPLAGKRIANSVAGLEKEIGEEEQWRLQELNRLKAVHVSLAQVAADGELGKAEMSALVEAMEEIGVPLVGFENDTTGTK